MSGFPILEVVDLELARRFYLSVLGASEVYRFPVADPVFVTLAVGTSELGLASVDAPVVPAGVVLWFYVDDVDAVTRAAVDGGAVLLEPPADQPWGERVSLVRDPVGTQVRLGAPLAP